MKSPIDRPQGHSHPPDHVQLVLVFDNNRLACTLFGEFDQNLALIEQKLHVVAIAHGNQVTLQGQEIACLKAQEVLETLYARLREGGGELTQGDVEGVIRMVHTQSSLSSAKSHKPSSGIKQVWAKLSTRRKTITARTSNQNAYMRAMEQADLIFGLGPAGTGKTYLAVAFAAACIDQGKASRLILSRPAVEAGESLGFLPGDMREKVDPYLRPLYDALYDLMPPERVERDLQSGVIEIAPLAFMRGRTLNDAVVILDEAQNTTPMQMKMFLTRLGHNTKMIITGDMSQIDLPHGQYSGLVQATKVLTDIKSISQIQFNETDVMRHKLVAQIVNAYAQSEKGDANS